MLDRNVGLARKQSEVAADVPAAREIRVQRKRTVEQRHHGAYVLAKIGQCLGGVRQDGRVVAGYLQRSPSEIGALQAIRRRIFAPTVLKQPKTAKRGPGERWSVTRIPRDRLLHKMQRFRDLPSRRQEHRI